MPKRLVQPVIGERQRSRQDFGEVTQREKLLRADRVWQLSVFRGWYKGTALGLVPTELCQQPT
jgi:hypothetical protein